MRVPCCVETYRAREHDTMGAHTHYSDQALAILADAVETNLAGDLAAERAGGVGMNPPMRRTPDELRELARTPLTAERRAIAREALERHGYAPVGTDETGATIYRRDYTRSSFAWLTPMSGDEPLAVNPRHVATVETSYTVGGERYAVVTLLSGETIYVRGTAEDTVAQLEAVAA